MQHLQGQVLGTAADDQLQRLQQQLAAQTSELKSAEASVEYVQRMLNAMTAENGDLRKQLAKYQAGMPADHDSAGPPGTIQLSILLNA